MEDRRRFIRYPVYCPVQFKCENGNPREASVTINLSEGGALISSKHLIESPDAMIVKLNMSNEEFFLRSRVVHVQHGYDTGICNLGIEFLDTPTEYRERFYEELEAMMLYQREYINQTGQEISLAEASARWYRDRGLMR